MARKERLDVDKCKREMCGIEDLRRIVSMPARAT